MNLSVGEFAATGEQLKFLASRHINKSDLDKYVKRVLEIDEKTEIKTRMQNIIDRIVHLAEFGSGNQIDEVRGTYYASFQGINEYLNHYAGRNTDTKAESIWLGKNATFNDNALRIALEMAS